MAQLPEALILEAARYAGLPYVWGGMELTAGVDCSGFVIAVHAKRGIAFPRRFTAEGLRQYCTSVANDQVQPGDLVFVEEPSDIQEPLAVDGHCATHVALSLGVGSGRVWSAQAPVVTEVVIAGNPWWQDRIIGFGRHPDVPATALPTTPERVFALAELLPVIEQWAGEYGVDPKVVAAMCWQESGGRNWRVHHDGTGHGLFGLDDGGGLIEFERWSGSTFGRGPSAGMLSPVLQIEFVCDWLSRNTATYGDALTAAQVWHRGPGLYRDERGLRYRELIAGLTRSLFGG